MNSFKKISLNKGEMSVYEIGKLKLHAYKTNDFIDDEVFIIEKNSKAVIIESPCFYDNNQELEQYINEKGMDVAGVLLSYHMAGGTFLSKTKKYATKNAAEYGTNGGGADLIRNFANSFGDIFDSSIHTVTDYITEGTVNIGGIDFIIIPTNDAFDIEIPEINVVYTHMLGHDCHSIIAGAGHADAIIAQLKGFIDKGYNLILTSHYTPEILEDVRVKIAYIKEIKNIAEYCKDADDFKTKVKEKYPDYSGENYLNMTAEFFFPAGWACQQSVIKTFVKRTKSSEIMLCIILKQVKAEPDGNSNLKICKNELEYRKQALLSY